MRRPRSSLVAALLGACLILGACNQGGSAESSETDEPAATATTAAQEPTSSAPGVSGQTLQGAAMYVPNAKGEYVSITITTLDSALTDQIAAKIITTAA